MSLRSEWLLTGNFVISWGPVGRDGLSCSSLDHGPSTRQIFPVRPATVPSPKRWEVPVLSGSVLWQTHWHNWPPLQYKKLSWKEPCSFFWHLHWERPFLQRLSYPSQLEFSSSEWRESVYYPRALASLTPQTVYISKKAHKPGPGWHLRNSAAG